MGLRPFPVGQTVTHSGLQEQGISYAVVDRIVDPVDQDQLQRKKIILHDVWSMFEVSVDNDDDHKKCIDPMAETISHASALVKPVKELLHRD